MAKHRKTEESRLVNVEIAPYNWERITKYIDSYNNSMDRTTSKLKYIDVINKALNDFFNEKITLEKN